MSTVQPVPTNNPRLKLPSSRRSRIYREICRRLMADARLKHAGVRWQVWDGSAGDDDPVSGSMCPLVRLTPYGESGGMRDNISQRGALRVEAELFTAGSNVEDVFDLWSVMEDVLYPSDQAAEAAVRDALHALGGERTPVRLGDPAVVESLGAGLLRAAGNFTVTLRIQG